jgi:hypothetical protein
MRFKRPGTVINPMMFVLKRVVPLVMAAVLATSGNEQFNCE